MKLNNGANSLFVKTEILHFGYFRLNSERIGARIATSPKEESLTTSICLGKFRKYVFT